MILVKKKKKEDVNRENYKWNESLSYKCERNNKLERVGHTRTCTGY